ncbi:MAG TPA: hypothetical protein VLM39_12770, partial [Ignavibacteriaceae bacterium]|nr:hypothetical protein [Ignavibacteriaceae bacterium]
MKILISGMTQSQPSHSAWFAEAMKRILLLLATAATLFTGQSNADAVSDWNATAVSVQLRIPNPNRGALQDLAYLHIAIYDAVNAIDGRYKVFAVDPPNKVPWASLEAAVHSAARRILMTLYPADSIYIESFYNSRISPLPNDSAKTKGIEIGNTTASMFLALRNGDGREA